MNLINTVSKVKKEIKMDEYSRTAVEGSHSTEEPRRSDIVCHSGAGSRSRSSKGYFEQKTPARNSRKRCWDPPGLPCLHTENKDSARIVRGYSYRLALTLAGSRSLQSKNGNFYNNRQLFLKNIRSEKNGWHSTPNYSTCIEPTKILVVFGPFLGPRNWSIVWDRLYQTNFDRDSRKR